MRRVAGACVVALLALGLSVSARPASAASITVTRTDDPAPNGCTPGDCSLREAVLLANSTAEADTIVLGADTYDLTIADPSVVDENGSQSGDLDIKAPLTIKGVFDATVIMQMTGSNRVIQLRQGTLTLKKVALSGGTPTAGSGGGLRVEAGTSATLVSTAVTYNSGASGGGIYTAGPLDLTDSVVGYNDSANDGGGIASIGGDMNVIRSTIINNDAVNTGTRGGGIVFVSSDTLTVTDSVIDGNTSTTNGGGGIFVGATDPSDGATFKLTRSLVRDNTTTGIGAGLLLGSGSSQTSKFRVSDSTISRNSTTKSGGGLFCACGGPVGAPLKISHATITDNTADSDDDSPTERGGAFSASSHIFDVFGSIIAGNHAGGDAEPDCGGQSFITLGANVVTEASCYDIGAQPSDAVAADASFLGPLASNGGPTQTHALITVAEPNDRDQTSACGGTDQRGVPRPYGAGCDSGAYERSFCFEALVNIVGTEGDDGINGTNGNDGILALGGNDVVHAGDGSDQVCGGAGDDKLFGGNGDDLLKGQGGIDKCFGEADTDTLVCETEVQD